MEEYMEDVKTLVGKLTLEEKVRLLSGKTFWTTYPVERLGIPSVKMTDGPHGTREEIEGGSITNVMKTLIFRDKWLPRSLTGFNPKTSAQV